ncbi:monocarboxylate transporter 12-like [Saccoglossus kowalevskii]
MKLISKEDGGWYGWMVVLASHFIQVLIIGCEIGMGVFLVEFMEYFGEGAGKTAIIQSLQAGMMSCPGKKKIYLKIKDPLVLFYKKLGVALIPNNPSPPCPSKNAKTQVQAPLISSLNNKFGTRPLVIIGGVLSSGGLILSSFANSINVLLVSYSIIVGIGFGFAYGPSIVIVGQYFHKQHALTNGIVYAGVGVGIMTLPPLYQILIDTYGWRGAMLVMAGINMNICVCGMLMRPPPKYDPEPKNVKSGNVTKYQLVDLCENGRLPAEGMESDYKQCRDEPQSSEYHMVTRDIKYVTTIISELLGLHLFKNSWFRTLCFTAFLIGVGDLISMVHYVSKVVSVGIDKLQAAFLLTIMGLSTIVHYTVFAMVLVYLCMEQSA